MSNRYRLNLVKAAIRKAINHEIGFQASLQEAMAIIAEELGRAHALHYSNFRRGGGHAAGRCGGHQGGVGHGAGRRGGNQGGGGGRQQGGGGQGGGGQGGGGGGPQQGGQQSLDMRAE